MEELRSYLILNNRNINNKAVNCSIIKLVARENWKKLTSL
jgi:hypothetical protein